MLGRWVRAIAAGLGLLAVLLVSARAHDLTITQVLASFEQPGIVDVRFDLDLTPYLASPEAYYALAIDRPEHQRQVVNGFLPEIMDSLQLRLGDAPLALVFQGFSLPTLSKEDFLDPTVDHFTTLHFIAVLPAVRDPIRLVIKPGSKVAYPVAFTVQVPSAHISEASWIEDESEESDEFDWATVAPRAGAVVAPVPPAPTAAVGAPSPSRRKNEPTFEVQALPWPHQLWTYLRLGFHHIVPEGMDHILFVLGLFFLGITWRKLISQTSVFTVAHATTLFLSSYGIFSLPSKYVEPLIALSIAFIAVENIVHPQLGVGRLIVVFCFGLIHGLGFASSLSTVPFPQHQFILALLGFNFGVDGGQLFIIALAFIAVGRFRKRPWFRARVAIPCSLIIALIGILWAAQRVMFYRHMY